MIKLQQTYKKKCARTHAKCLPCPMHTDLPNLAKHRPFAAQPAEPNCRRLRGCGLVRACIAPIRRQTPQTSGSVYRPSSPVTAAANLRRVAARLPETEIPKFPRFVSTDWSRLPISVVLLKGRLSLGLAVRLPKSAVHRRNPIPSIRGEPAKR